MRSGGRRETPPALVQKEIIIIIIIIPEISSAVKLHFVQFESNYVQCLAAGD